MAPRTRARQQPAPPPPPAPPPAPLTEAARARAAAGLAVALAVWAAGVAGLLILMDHDARAHWYSATAVADAWRWLATKNPMFLAAAFNGGAYFSIRLGHALVVDARTRRGAAAATRRAKRK